MNTPETPTRYVVLAHLNFEVTAESYADAEAKVRNLLRRKHVPADAVVLVEAQ